MAFHFFSFIKTYPGFMLFVLAAVCFFFAHNAINDYMIQIITPLGGTEAQMGIAVSCAAFLELPAMALIDKIIKKIEKALGIKLTETVQSGATVGAGGNSNKMTLANFIKKE